MYDILYATQGVCPTSSIESVTTLITDDPSFTLVATCDGVTSNVLGTIGGIFTFNTLPSDAAIIDAATGVVSGGTYSATYDILYTTLGVCSSSDTESISALSEDDASFILTPLCDGGSVNVTGLTGGIFTFNVAPTDAASIDATTGEITGGSSNTSYDVLYTTSGTCPSSSVQSVVSLITDDASFTMTAGCDGGTANITGTTGGTFSFNVSPLDAASIAATSGQVTNVTDGVTYDILYTTSGTCSASSVGSFTAIDTDDATFSLIATCAGGTALVSGTTGGLFTFNVPPLDAATIDVSTGAVSNGTSGVSYDVVYTTNGACPSNSTETLTVLTTDDAMFTISPTCDGGVPVIIGTTGGTFTFAVAPTDTASINAATGEITGGSSSASYDVLYTTSGFCPISSVETFTVDDCTILIIPTAFTPDNDGDNDRWEILELDFKYPENIVRIFNRWGDLIFEHHASVSQPYDSNRWDGTYQGSIMPIGSYYFIIDLNDGVSEHETGTVSIILNR